MNNELMQLLPRGESNAIPMAELAMLRGETEREARREIHDLRCNGEIVCSSANGYFRPADNQELLTWYRVARCRGLATLKSISAARRKLKAAGIDPDGGNNGE